jgi:NADPH-dependent 2,4-dienoyl-CoA reductase/sulfur reductase-like enzyme
MSSHEKAKVLIIGAGPAGAGVAMELAGRGIGPIVLIDRRDTVGGVPSLYRTKPGGVPTFVLWRRGRVLFGQQYAERLAAELRGTEVDLRLENQVTEVVPREKRITVVGPSSGQIHVSAQAVVLACGARERSLAERGWTTGSRPGGVLFTKNLLDLLDRNEAWSAGRPVILGSDVIAYAAAAKLAKAGTPKVAIVDQRGSAECSLPSRIYFSRWGRPRYHGAAGPVAVSGERSIEALRLLDGTELPCDRLVVCGDLAPNSELALMAGLRVQLPSRRPVADSKYRLSEPGWFVAGNILGGERGAEWCYHNGRRVAASVAAYLASAG